MKIYGLSFIILVLASCVCLDKRVHEDGEMKLSTNESECVAPWKVDDYVEDVVQNVCGYERPKGNPVVNKISWMFVLIGGGMFIAAFAFFAIAYLTHQYKCNVLGFISLLGSGTAIGFAEVAPFAWVIPVTGVLGGIIWWFTHGNKEFSLYIFIKDLFSNEVTDGNN